MNRHVYADREPRNLGEKPVPDHLWPVLEQLVVGATDLAASRRLNMSPRTFSRRVAELLDSLGVQTRFQCGVEVARRGWLRQPQPSPRRNPALLHETGEVP
jgi:DNA-binding NarL/FixJ family response regulator